MLIDQQTVAYLLWFRQRFHDNILLLKLVRKHIWMIFFNDWVTTASHLKQSAVCTAWYITLFSPLYIYITCTAKRCVRLDVKNQKGF